jgi:hypothetical protein
MAVGLLINQTDNKSTIFVFLLILYIQTIKQIDIVREINETIKRVSLFIKLDLAKVSPIHLH